MYDWFTNIVRGLKALGKYFPNAQLVKKLLYNLPKSWRPKVTTIEEATNLNTLKLDELVGSLLTYEVTLKHENKRGGARKEDTKKMNIVLKSSLQEEEKSEKEESEENEDIAMLVKMFSKFMKRNYKGRRHPRKDVPKGEHNIEHLICYECRKSGHTKYECRDGNKIT